MWRGGGASETLPSVLAAPLCGPAPPPPDNTHDHGTTTGRIADTGAARGPYHTIPARRQACETSNAHAGRLERRLTMQQPHGTDIARVTGQGHGTPDHTKRYHTIPAHEGPCGATT